MELLNLVFLFNFQILVEGLIRLDDLTDDHYTYDESTIRLIGTKNKRGYRLGDQLNVVVKAANKEAHTIDFVLAKDKKMVEIKNRKANFDYEILETYEAGIVLTGTEIKSIRAGKANLKDSYAIVRNNEIYFIEYAY